MIEAGSDQLSAAQTIALNALAPRAKSRGELASHLKRRGIEDLAAEVVLDRLEKSGLVNDLEFARAWTDSRMRAKNLSKRVIAGELREKGVSAELIAIALDEIDNDLEYRAALELGMRKARSLKRFDEETRQRRLISALQRKGFNFSVISAVLKEI
jgi:regulatory protein